MVIGILKLDARLTVIPDCVSTILLCFFGFLDVCIFDELIQLLGACFELSQIEAK